MAAWQLLGSEIVKFASTALMSNWYRTTIFSGLVVVIMRNSDETGAVIAYNVLLLRLVIEVPNSMSITNRKKIQEIMSVGEIADEINHNFIFYTTFCTYLIWNLSWNWPWVKWFIVNFYYDLHRTRYPMSKFALDFYCSNFLVIVISDCIIFQNYWYLYIINKWWCLWP